jgi:anti-sigma B factor antagonist
MQHQVTVTEIDMATAFEFRAELLAADSMASGDGAILELDFSAVTFIASAGLQVLIEVNDDLAPLGRRLVITNAAPNIERVFELVGLAYLFSDGQPLV